MAEESNLPEIPSREAISSISKSHWSNEPVQKPSFLTTLRRFPRNGAIGLTGSALTAVLSWLTLFLFSNHEVVSEHMLKPPAWTSIITSLNSIFIQMAVQQGISISWWQRAASEKITVAELHENWLLGSGIVSALGAGKKFNFVALATIFVFTVPLNGLILANAVSLVTVYRQSEESGNTKFLVAPSLPLGYSGYLNADGLIEGYTSLWQNSISSVFSSNSRAAFLSPIAGDRYTTCLGSCNATLQGVGFSAICDRSKVPYDLPPDDNPQNLDYNSALMKISLTWNAEKPNFIDLVTTNKRHSSCVGNFEVTTCELQMAKVLYNVNVQKNLTGHGNFWWSFSNPVIPGALSSYNPAPVVEYYGIDPNEGNTKSTFGGIAQVIAAYYNTSTTFQSTSNFTSLDLSGIYAQQVPPTYHGQIGLDANKCNTSYSNFTTPIPSSSGTYKNLTDAILTSLQHVFFFTSVSAASSLSSLNPDTLPLSYIQTIEGNNDLISHEVYKIAWIYWWGSFIITFSIILFILPTYYGFWRLEEKKSMAPLTLSSVFARAEKRGLDDGVRRVSTGVEGNGDDWRLPSVLYARTMRGWGEGQRRSTRFTGDNDFDLHR